MGEREHSSPRHPTADRSHETILDLLPEYATALTLARRPQERYPAVVEHLERCATCRDELEALLAMVGPIYRGEIEPAPAVPQVDLSFLRPQTAGPQPAPPAALRPLVVAFSEALLGSLRQPAFRARGESLLRYTPASQPDLSLTVEIFAADAPQLGDVQVLIDRADRDPFDQGGVAVTLTIGEHVRKEITGDTGSVTFSGVPLERLAELRVEVQLPEP